MRPEVYAAVLSFLGQPASNRSENQERRSSSKPRAFRISRPAKEEQELTEELPRPEENDSLRVARQQREAIEEAAQKGWEYLGEHAQLHSNAIPFSDSIQGGDPLVSAIALKWLVSRDQTLRDHLLGQAPRDLIPESRPAGQDQLDRAVHWLIAYWRSGRLSIPELCLQASRVLSLIHEAGSESGKSPAWDVGTSAFLLEPLLLAIRYGAPIRSMETVRALIHQVESHLITQSYTGGTHAYPLPEIFLCQVSEVWRQTTPLSASLRQPLEAAVRDRWWSDSGPVREPLHRRALALSALMIAAENLHLSEVNLGTARQELIRLQSSEGAFAPSAYRRSKGSYLGSRVTSTIFAVRALQGQPRTGGWGLGRQWTRKI